MVTSPELQNSSALSGRTLADAVGGSTLNHAQNPCSAQIQTNADTAKYRKPALSRKDRPLLSHQKMKDRKSRALPVLAGQNDLARGMIDVVFCEKKKKIRCTVHSFELIASFMFIRVWMGEQPLNQHVRFHSAESESSFLTSHTEPKNC